MSIDTNLARLLTKVFGVVIVIGALVALYVFLTSSGLWSDLVNRQALDRWLNDMGPMGPLAIIALMTVAIVMSPLPSAPIALAAGAAYGHTWGTVYVMTGSLSGAMIAFCISRFLGREFVRRWFGVRSGPIFLSSQNVMMAAVFASRLMPFLSFDLISYAAGLTPLTFWRFALATAAGILPASFLLAHFGSELLDDDPTQVAITIGILGAITLLSVLLAWRSKPRRNDDL